jgi:hypothetical protein
MRGDPKTEVMPFLEVESVYFSDEMMAHRERVLGDVPSPPAPPAPAPQPGFLRQLCGALWQTFTALISLYWAGCKLAMRSPGNPGLIALMFLVTVGQIVLLIYGYRFLRTLIRLVWFF